MPTLTSKQLFSTGIILTVVGLATLLYFAPLVFALLGDDAMNTPAMRWSQMVLAQVAFPLGLALIVFVLVVRVIESIGGADITTAAGQAHEDTVPVAAPATPAVARMFWIGVTLVILGLIVQGSLEAWLYDVSGAADVSAGLARDVLSLIGSPVEAVAMPLGILLGAGSMAVRTLKHAPAAVHATPSSR